MRAPRTLNVAEMTLCELGTVVYGSDCPVARAECLAEISSRRQVSNDVGYNSTSIPNRPTPRELPHHP